jgi:outer membrane lipoprotein carrier protein
MKHNWLFIVLLFCSSNWLYASDSGLDRFFQDLYTLHGQFVQQLYNEQNRLIETSEGLVYMQRPNQFRWEYQKPYQQLIVADGERVWIYDKDLEQITMKPLNKILGKTPAFLLSRGRKIEEDFFVNLKPSQSGKTRFELLPKDADASFEKMYLNLDGKTLHSLELLDNLGQTTYITFPVLRPNFSLDEGLFIFTPPAGVDILRDK